MEDRAGGYNRILRRAEPDPERESGLLARLRGREEGIERPVVRFRRCAGGVHRLDVDAGVPLHQVDTRARTLELTADRGWHGNPVALGFTEILDRRIHGPVLIAS